LKKFLLKKLLYIFLITGSWFITPIYFTAVPKLENSYSNLSNKLTPNSVNVSGYYRKDGSYVNSYSRRPPGAVDKDKPTEKEMSKVSTLLSIINIAFYGSYALLFVAGLNVVLTSKEEYHNFLFDQVIKQVNIDLSFLKNKPSNLINRKISRYDSYSIKYNCIRCGKSIGHNEFNWSNLAKRKPQKICLECIINDKTNRFTIEMEYVLEYEKSIKQFVSDFEHICFDLDKNQSFNRNKIENYFNRKLIESRV
jgi:hypothetical protein